MKLITLHKAQVEAMLVPVDMEDHVQVPAGWRREHQGQLPSAVHDPVDRPVALQPKRDGSDLTVRQSIERLVDMHNGACRIVNEEQLVPPSSNGPAFKANQKRHVIEKEIFP